MCDAAPEDDDIAVLGARIESQFHDNQGAVVEPMRAWGVLREGLDVERATDILWTLVHPSPWRLLVGVRGWSPEEYEASCAEVACAELLR